MYSLVSHVEYVPHALLRLEKRKKQTVRRTDGRQTVTLRFALDGASLMKDFQCYLRIIRNLENGILTYVRGKKGAWSKKNIENHCTTQ